MRCISHLSLVETDSLDEFWRKENQFCQVYKKVINNYVNIIIS